MQAHLKVDTQTCKTDPKGKKQLHLFQFSQDQLNMDYKCEECECIEDKVPNADQCNKRGTLACGACICDDGWKGKENHTTPD